MNERMIRNLPDEVKDASRADTEKMRDLRNTLDFISDFSGRVTLGHDSDCSCNMCLVHNAASKAVSLKI